MCLGTGSYFHPLEEKMFCTKCGTAVDGLVLLCSFGECEIYGNCNEHPPSTDDEKRNNFLLHQKSLQIRNNSFVFEVTTQY